VNNKEREETLTLELLEAIHEKSDLTQRSLAQRMNVALGLTNSYLKRCVRKGFIKVHQAPANRYLYYLTPKGFSEKSRLTARYLASSFRFYHKAGASCQEAFLRCEANGWRRVVLCGASDLAEIASLRALDRNIEVVAVYDPRREGERFLNRHVQGSLEACEPFDVCLVTALFDPGGMFRDLRRSFPRERIMVPRLLGLTVG